MPIMNNQRKYFQVKLNSPLCAKMKIAFVNNTFVTTGSAFVCIKDIGPGGLAFKTHLNFPAGNLIILSFKFTLHDQELEVLGCMVRKTANADKTFEYGVKFVAVLNIERANLVRMLGLLSIRQKKGTPIYSCSLCQHNHLPCWKKERYSMSSSFSRSHGF